MKSGRSLDPRQALILTSLLITSALLVFLLYRPALSGSFHFDDAHTLQGLAEVSDRATALHYLLTGDTGPVGRPISLATFLLHREAWPSQPRSFLLGNMLTHLVNGVLAGWLMFLMARARPERFASPLIFASAAALLWMVFPINATASLQIVQRMTSLSGTFVLCGLVLYVWGRSLLATRPRSGAILMAIGIGLFTSLAMLAKENGVLLPLYALVLEATLLAPLDPGIPRRFRQFRLLLLAIPVTVLALYLTSLLPGLSERYLVREFTVGDRLLTQGYVLADYLRLMLIPRPLAIHPFYDDYPVIAGITGFAFAVLWLTLGSLALAIRRRAPVFSFAILWFLAGHLLESGFIPLELAFLHRNYLPSLGIAVLVVYLFLSPELRIFPERRWLLAPYVGLLMWILVEVTTVWGRPALAAELWLLDRMDSVRASEYLERMYRRHGDERTADRIVADAFERNRQSTLAAVQGFRPHCTQTDPGRVREELEKLLEILRNGHFANRTTQAVDTLVTQSLDPACPALGLDELELMISALFENPRFTTRRLQMHNLHMIRFRTHYLHGDLTAAMDSLTEAYSHYPDHETLRLQVELLVSQGRATEARQTLVSARLPPAFNIIDRFWYRGIRHEIMLDRLTEYVESASIR
jgi:protein O-mannosyl-transferase